MAMHAEAAPVAAGLGLVEDGRLHPRLPAVVLRGRALASAVVLVVHGVDERFGVDSIGTQPAAVTAFAACERLRPRVVINAGTAGGFGRAGAQIGDVYISDGAVVYHSRRIALGEFHAYGVG